MFIDFCLQTFHYNIFNPNEGGKPHVHYKDGTSSNNNGSIPDAGKGTPITCNKVIDWLKNHNWIPPSKQ